jgi:glycosyltransferase involved in cell wall biosynthesis
VKVLFWLNTFLPDVGGIQTLCERLVPELQRRGHEVAMLTAYTPGATPDHLIYNDQFELWRVDSIRPLFQRNPGGMLRAKQQIARIIDGFDPELIHIHPCGPELSYYSLTQRVHPRPTVLTVHNNYSQVGLEFGETASFGRALKGAERIAAVSDEARRWLLDEAPALAPKTATVHNGIPPASLPIAPLPWDPPLIMWAGRIEEQKRLDVLLQSFAIVARQHATVRLRIVGDGSRAPEIRALADTLGLADRVEFVGRVEPHEVPAHFNAATLFTLSSDYEGLPMVALEAGQYGRPLVTTDAGGTAEALIPGESGLVVPPGDPDALAAATLELLEDRQRTERYGDAARRYIAESFSLEACAAAYERLYAEALEQAQAAAAVAGSERS